MPVIKYLAEKEAKGKAKEVYEKIKKELGIPAIPNVYKAMGRRPEFLEALFEMDKAVFGDGLIPRKYKELMAIAVSAANGCTYCAYAHGFLARQHGASEEEIAEALSVTAVMSAYNNFNKALDMEPDIK